MTNEQQKQEIEKLKQELESKKESIKLRKEKEQLNNQLKQVDFQDKHPKLLKVTNALERGTNRIFKSIGTGISKIPEKLAKSDKWIAEQEAKEKAIKTNKPTKQPPINDTLNLLD